MRSSSRTLLLFAFLIIICSSILPAFSLQNIISILSHGTVDYPGLPPPSPNTWNLDITVTPANSGKAVIVAPTNVDVQEIPVAQSITVSAMPNQGYSFVNWKLDNVSSTSNPITIPSQTAGSTHTLIATFDTVNVPSGKYVGFRCNTEATPEYWISVAERYTDLVPETSPGGIWIIPSSKVLTYSAEMDAMLAKLDKAHVKVYLQAGEEVPYVWNQYPASCDVLLQGLLDNYGHHSCVLGVGFDLEQRGSTWDDYGASEVSDEEATRWVSKVKEYNPDFKLFLKHWATWIMPPTVREGIIFVSMFQYHSSLDEMMSLFQPWGNHFWASKVAFQVGYPSDKWWWSQLSNPPRDIATRIFQDIPNAEGVFWVNCGGSVWEVFP